MADSDLPPCPYCGGTGVLEDSEWWTDKDHGYTWWVECER